VGAHVVRFDTDRYLVFIGEWGFEPDANLATDQKEAKALELLSWGEALGRASRRRASDGRRGRGMTSHIFATQSARDRRRLVS
jgi:hypothetical protein